MIYYLLYAICAAVHLFACIKDKQTLRKITKFFLLPILFFAYYAQGGRSILVIVGIIAGWIGDILLTRPNEYIFRALGSAFFVIGHIAYLYTMLFVMNGKSLGWTLFAMPLIFAGMAFFVYSRTKEPIDKDMRAKCLVYFILLGIMTGVSAAEVIGGIPLGNLGGLSHLAGYLLFSSSDFMLVNQWFTVGDPSPGHDFRVMLTYILGQLFIVTGFLI